MRRLVCMICFLALAGVGSGEAQALQAPDVVPGKFVYTIPAGFEPPLIGAAGMREIQSAAAKLHFHYYVVLVEQLPGDTDDAAADYIDALAEKWQVDPDFNSARASIFMLSYTPRKYRFLAGSYWEHQLGFDANAHAPYNAIFVSYVQSSRKDPKTGIIKMMQAVDTHLFQESDPATIARRKEAERKAEIARREAEKKALEESQLQMARNDLRNETNTLNALLSEDPMLLPKDLAVYRSAAERATEVVLKNDREQILAKASAIRILSGKLRIHVEARRSEVQERAIQAAQRVAAIVIVSILAIIAFILRLRAYTRLKHAFQSECRQWEERILNAQPKYLSFESERGMIAGLKELTGRTKQVYDSTTREVDYIFIAIGAMQSHIDYCRSTAKGGSFLLIRPLKRALDDLRGEFTFDTNQLGEVSLFAPEMRQVTLRPAEIAEQLDERFRRAIDQWNHLKEAAEIRFKQAEAIFTQTKLDEMLKLADENGIPHRWLADHPLFGDETSDQTLYTHVNEGRMNDPVAFLERLEELQAKETEVAGRLRRLVDSVSIAKSERIDGVPDLAMTVLQPQDDPTVAFDTARREEARFSALLASRDDVAEIERQAVTVRDLYRRCVEQIAIAQAAVAQAGQEIAHTRVLGAEVSNEAQRTEREIRDRETIHSTLRDPQNFLNTGRRFLEAGETDLASAAALLPARRHLDALKATRQANGQFEAARRTFQDCLHQLAALDDAKREFDKKLDAMEDRRAEIESRLHRYGGSPSQLASIRRPQAGPLDYLILLNQLNTLEDSWESELRRTRLIYEDAERRRRAAKERERHESLGSSSGSHWGGGGHSSSGGSWSGGGGSSSPHSSSGGSW